MPNKAYKEFMLKSDGDKAGAASAAGYTTIEHYEAALKGVTLAKYNEQKRKVAPSTGDVYGGNLPDRDAALAAASPEAMEDAAAAGAGNVGDTENGGRVGENTFADPSDTEESVLDENNEHASETQGGQDPADVDGSADAQENKPGFMGRVFGGNKAE